MILHNEYLTDEELEALISEVEADEIVPAPPGVAESICRAVFNEVCAEGDYVGIPTEEGKSEQPDPSPKHEVKKNIRKADFAGYCIRVVISAAAAIAFIFITPYLPEFGTTGGEEPATYIDRETYLEENQREYPTREEVLNEENMWSALPDIKSIFDGNSVDYDVKDENGGQ